MIKEGGGESKIAGMAREQLKVFTDKYARCGRRTRRC